MRKATETIAVPVHLVRLLLAEPSDFKNPAKYADTQALGKALLKVLAEAAKVTTARTVSPSARKAMSEGMRKFWARRKAAKK